MSDDLTPQELDELAGIKRELMSDTDVRAAMQARVDDMAVKLLSEAIHTCRRLKKLDDPMRALTILADATIWWVEFKQRVTREVPEVRRPRATVGSFER